jgi:GNAT superfamily N-acetyltransferase
MLPIENLSFRELHPDDKVNSFSLGKKEHLPLKIFLKKDALNFHLLNIAKTYVLADEPPSQIGGYITLMCSELVLDNHQRPQENKRLKRYDAFPAIKLARLAVDKDFQGKGLGILLIDNAISIVKNHIMPNAGCRFLTVDAKPDAINFYEKAGFSFLDVPENKENQNSLMLLDLQGVI